MKCPKSPDKPYPPYKPIPPPEKIERNKTIGSFAIETYGSYTFLEFRYLLLTFFSVHNVQIDDVKFDFEVTKEWCYDDCTCGIVANVFTTEMIDTPNYKATKKQYDAALDKYHKDMAKYEELNKKYEADMKQYQADYDLYMLEYTKKELKKLEKKVAKRKV